MPPPSFSQVNLTSDVTGILPLANGGTNAALAAVNGGVVYSNGTQLQITPIGISGQILQSNGAGIPTWVNAPAGTVTGTGIATQVAFWNSASALSGDNNLWWDNTNDRLGIGITAPEQPLHVVKNTGSGVTADDIVNIETRNATTTATSLPPSLNLIRQFPTALFVSGNVHMGGVIDFALRVPASATFNDVSQIQSSSLNSNSIMGFATRTGMTNGNPATGTLTGSLTVAAGITYNMALNGNVLAVGNLLGGATTLSTDAAGNIIRTPSWLE